MYRFYAPGIDSARREAVLPPDESHHLVRVLRLASGDRVAVFDGRGHEFLALVVSADRHAATLELLEPLPASSEPPTPIVLVQAVLKGDKMDGVVRDATMAGVSRIVPVVTERTLAKLSTLSRAKVHERWERVAVSSAKQCGRSRLPAIEPARTFASWLDEPFDGIRVLLAEPRPGVEDGRPLRAVLGGSPPASVSCVVGPEGGWSAEERTAAADGGCASVTLGPMTLRADAAGLVAVALVTYALQPD